MINELHIHEAYLFLRDHNHNIPSETFDFMKDASLEKLKEIDEEERKQYDPNFGDGKVCKCGHYYFRHFINGKHVGCEFCHCNEFKKRKGDLND